MKKRMIAGLMAVLMTMSLAACGSSAGSSDASGTGSAATSDNSAAQAASGDKVTLSLCWWGNQTRNDVTKKAVRTFHGTEPQCRDQGRVYRLVRLLGLSFLQWQQAATFPSILSRWITLSATVSAERPAC